MSGWIKLWRNLFTDELLNLESKAFKLWIYCLVTATPYPDPAKGLEVGELWLSYRTLQKKLKEGNKQHCLRTLTSAMKLLEAQGYLRLEPSKSEGTKVTITNWTQHQSSGTRAASSPDGQAAVPPPMLLNVFEQEFARKLSTLEQGWLSEWESTYSPGLICEALTLGSYQSKHSLAYIGGILKKKRAEQLNKSLGKAKGTHNFEWNMRRQS